MNMLSIGTLLVALFAALVLSCGPTGTKTQSGDESAVTHTMHPIDLTATSQSGQLELAWRVNGNEMFSGFQIYITDDTSDLKSVRPFNSSPYPGDLDPSDSIIHFTAAPLPNGIPQFAWVQILFPDNRLSPASDIVRAIPYARDTITLHVRFKDDRDGYSFVNQEYVRSDETSNDLYYFVGPQGDFLASPRRLDGFLRTTGFTLLPGVNDLEQALDILPTMAMMPSEDKIAAIPGAVVLATLDDEIYTVLRIASVDGNGDDRTVTLEYISGIRLELL